MFRPYARLLTVLGKVIKTANYSKLNYFLRVNQFSTACRDASVFEQTFILMPISDLCRVQLVTTFCHSVQGTVD